MNHSVRSPICSYIYRIETDDEKNFSKVLLHDMMNWNFALTQPATMNNIIALSNPASNEVNISIIGNKNYANGVLQIINSLGIKIIELNIDISSNYKKLIKEKWVDGVYIVVLNTDKEIIKQSITIQH